MIPITGFVHFSSINWYILNRRVVVICSGQPPEVLTEMNSIIRRIDLICKLCSPVFSGLIISFVSLKASATFLVLWNLLSVWLQYWLLTSVYNGIPTLSESSQRRVSKRIPTDYLETAAILDENENSTSLQEGNLVLETSDWKKRISGRLSRLPCFSSWIVYAKQEIVMPGVALALLYFTVLRSVSWSCTNFFFFAISPFHQNKSK